MEENNLLRKLPAVDAILQHPEMKELVGTDRTLAVNCTRRVLERCRRDIISRRIEPPSREYLISEIKRHFVETNRSSLRRVINATGIVLHTNLGRAVLSHAACRAAVMAAGSYTNLEYNLVDGGRGRRYDHVSGLLQEITGAEAALVVNNNAAAVLLVLSVLAARGETIISRGQLVEIGGSFRIPEVMAQSGTRLVEVGTTNKTYISDYEAAITPDTALLLKVHPSNFRLRGFTHEVTTAELVELGRARGIPVVEDLGSGFLIDLEEYGITGEPAVQAEVKLGVDVLTFSGDKLLGGPQAGIIVGREKFIDRIAGHPLTRALRVDKMTLAALEATLKAYRNPEGAIEEIPTLKALVASPEILHSRAVKLKELLEKILDSQACFDIQKITSPVGGGSLPLIELPSWGVCVKVETVAAATLARRLRQADTPVLTRIKDDSLIIDVRTLLPGDEKELAISLSRALED